MRKKRILLLLLLAIVCITTILVYITNFANTQANSPENPQENSLQPPTEPFIIPENPLGPLGVMSALAVAFGMFALRKKRP